MLDNVVIEAVDAPPVVRRNPRDAEIARSFLDCLVNRDLLDRLAADRAYQAQQETNERIDVVLAQLGLLSEAAQLEALASYFTLPVAAVADYPSEVILPDLLEADFLVRARFIPVAATEASVTLISADPFATDTLAAVAYLVGRPVKVMLGSAKDIEGAIDRLYAEQETVDAHGPDPDAPVVAQEDDVQRLRDIASEAPVIRLVNRLIAAAIEQRASDIHIEPFADNLRVRYRIDGALTVIDRLAPEMQPGVASRIKILGRLNIAERRVPQDGRCKFIHAGREVDLRISTVPLMHGESIVLRILDREAVELDFKALGFDARAQAKLDRMFQSPNGIVLVTGPTGSGKTTTLYAALKQLNSTERKVFTVEDPIEYQLNGINQMQIKPNIGLDFAHALRSILRQDPDVVMLGEMRDVETARTGIQASLTGHLVLSTLHTNSAAASITRLLDMGVEDYLLATTIIGILAQRLVRRICPLCAEAEREPSVALALLSEELRDFAKSLPANKMKRPVGCDSCRNTGFKGRTTISEFLLVDNDIRSRIVRGVNDREIEVIAKRNGMESLLQDGLRKVMAGETTLGEVLRVART